MASEPAADRRDAVLESALLTFARHGYRKTSMDEVARAARISRPGLYFLFESKEALFRAAVTRALEEDLAAAERILGDARKPLRERVSGAFDRWAGRYAGPLSRDVTGVIEQNPDLLGAIVETAPARFEALVTDAIAEVTGRATATRVTQTLISASVGLKHQVESREAYLARFATAVELLIPQKA
ncbi:DNA-binding transcriptional regulator, AcrR family [Amycolatopsis pretoriensis]|uniref:DNA-binding transcriptional regulator, AcrR family n=1 Tax=Amycolatopsis pretoriensis TaxID=218821 RepID=A0A1H5RHL7_9PSEU|nr:TetR/AcrR family transcriptional regulator [Amycolatopsis pretoriensis]SEF37819.1 DNA-binding transcriptional regulator, AcrR family [Amycolatopsis pretoriensis]